MGHGLKRARKAARATRERVYDFDGLAKALETLREDLGDDVTLEDVKRHPSLGRLFAAADQFSNIIRRDALDYVLSRPRD